MSVLDQIAYYQNRRDELPNQILARQLAESSRPADIHELVENLANPIPAIRSDCLKVLYELGFLAPEWIADYVQDFLGLLQNRDNRMVWGAMLALSTIAALQADRIFPHIEGLKNAMEKGSVITVDNGIKTLALVAAQNPAYQQAIFPYLLDHLSTCRSKEVPQHAEKTLPAVTSVTKSAFIQVLTGRLPDLTGSQVVRLKRVIKIAAA